MKYIIILSLLLGGCVSGKYAVKSNGIPPARHKQPPICILNVDGIRINEIDIILNRLILENGYGTYTYLTMPRRPNFCRYMLMYDVNKRTDLMGSPLQYAKLWLYYRNQLLGIGTYKNNHHYFFTTNPSTEQRLRPIVNQLLSGVK